MSEMQQQRSEPFSDPDVQLMLEVQKGNVLAFEELMNRNQTRVHSLLQNIVGNWQLAEDLTQEVFFRIYKARESYHPDALFSTWLFRIVHNLALNSLRNKNRHPELLFGGSIKTQSSSSSQSHQFAVEDLLLAQSSLMPTRQTDKKELRKIVQLAIESLGKRQRMALLLHRFEGMSYQEVADVMQLSAKAVKSLLCRARLNLKEILKPYVEEGRFPL
ncbi:MAG: RNA polymerase sigma factor [Planctomycetia bacterium]|nr:RNA polymerase sigma factor [Planctomycetia bacterium]